MEEAMRIKEVQDWQRYYNVEPRSDSRLTLLYASGQLGQHVTADAVARELLCTDYIYKHTLYGEVLEVFMRRVADRLRTYHESLSWTATWEIVRFYAPIALKLMCVSSAGCTIPDQMPKT